MRRTTFNDYLGNKAFIRNKNNTLAFLPLLSKPSKNIGVILQKYFNRMSCPLDGSEAGGDLVLIQTSVFCRVCQVLLMLTGCIYISKAERSVSKQNPGSLPYNG